eukprot:1210328-Pyramimonas_sp.AAC.1
MVRGPQGTEMAKKHCCYGCQLTAEEDGWTTYRLPGLDALVTVPSNLGPAIDERAQAEAVVEGAPAIIVRT